MSMLAGPRRKQKVINLRAKNNAWSNDTNKFGQRMLEKMGWSSGKGLGAKENGIVEHVVARYKNDDRGLGFDDKNDQWTKHEDDFNALLSNLSNADSNEDKLHSGVSLEVKSKKSKARIHYHKFTRGKDIARYSEKDLANIFGKKSLKNEAKAEEPAQEIDYTKEKVFTEKGSMEDYFKTKMAALSFKNKQSYKYNVNNDDVETDYAFKGFSSTNDELDPEEPHKGFGFQPFSLYESSEKSALATDEISPELTTEKIENFKKSKKKKKFNRESEPVVEEYTEINELGQIPCFTDTQSREKVKKTKKKKIFAPALEEEDVPKKKKSKKKESQVTELIQEINTSEDVHVPKKKKKRKNKLLCE